MYGLVNTAIAEMTRAAGGEDAWQAVCTHARIPPTAFIGMTAYPDEVTYRLVDGASAVLGLTPQEVLTAFGRAYGKLPDSHRDWTREQESFLSQAVAGLAQGGRVISVRLALFAEMVKGKPWTTAALEEVGGTEGVGVTFLEETFSSPQANPKHRLHQEAAQAVLKALLPQTGTDI